MNCKINIMYDGFDSATIEELNELSDDCQFRIIKQKGLSIPPDVITIIFELLKNIGYSAAYDMLKLSLNAIVSKISIANTKEIETKIVAVLGDKKAEFIVPFKLTKKQKDKIIDAVAEKLSSIEEE